MNREQLFADVETTFAQCLEICRKKNADYSSEADPFKNLRASEVVGIDPLKAILVRLTDKFTRLGNLVDKPPTVADESIDDTIHDVINYMALFKALYHAQ